MHLRILLFFSAVCFFSCAQQSKNPIGKLSIIQEGQGLDNIVIGKVNRDSLKHIFPMPYDSIDHENYSTAIHYSQLGAYFYYLQNDDLASIFAMSFDTAFKGLTSKGFDIHRMTVKDMIDIYGKPRWQMLKSAHMLYAHYDSVGIYFSIVPANTIEPDFFADVKEDDNVADSLAEVKHQNYYSQTYVNSSICEITVGIPGTDY
jgi:hypothetical protein